MRSNSIYIRLSQDVHSTLVRLAEEHERTVPWIATRLVEKLTARLISGETKAEEWLTRK